MTQLYQDLIAVADLIEREGWIQGDFRNKHGRCLACAIFDAVPENRRHAAVHVALTTRISRDGRCGTIVGWNDCLERFKTEVIALVLATAAAEARS